MSEIIIHRPKKRKKKRTEEDAFHDALDANPSDATTRLVFADWLQERDPPDPRAEGYRVLGLLGRRPFSELEGLHKGVFYWGNLSQHQNHESLPESWFRKLDIPFRGDWFVPEWSVMENPAVPKDSWITSFSRQQCEDAAALAWLELTDEEKRDAFKAMNLEYPF